jgi:hypothetical protein
MNLTLRSLSLALVLSKAPFFSPSILSKNSALTLNSCLFRRFALPVFTTRATNSLTFSSFDTVFHEAKAVSMEFEPEEPPIQCNYSTDETLPHQLLFKVCIHFKRCSFLNCTSEVLGGALDCNHVNTSIQYCTFRGCSAKYGGSLYYTRGKRFSINMSLITETHAERFGAMYVDTRFNNYSTTVKEVNISYSYAKFYVAGVRVEVTIPKFTDVSISHTTAPKYGALWDWTTLPVVAQYVRCRFLNMTSGTEGCAITFFHWLHSSVLQSCIFAQGHGPAPKYVFLYSTEAVVKIADSYFDAPREISIGDRFGENTITIEESTRFETE